MRIGFFDSGVGGLTVLHDAMKRLGHADYVYYAATDNVPDGEKTAGQVRRDVFAAADIMVRLGIDVLVVACNTATSVAIGDLRSAYALPIIGMEPAVKPAVENHKGKRVLVTATALTLKEEKLKSLITRLDCEDIVDLLPLPGLVGFAERAVFDDTVVLDYLADALKDRDIGRYQTVVLGCTHFIFYRDVFRKLLGPDIDIVDGNLGTVNRLVGTVESQGIPPGGSGRIAYYHSGRAVRGSDELARYAALLKRLDNMDSAI
jgi:glutamate racemase